MGCVQKQVNSVKGIYAEIRLENGSLKMICAYRPIDGMLVVIRFNDQYPLSTSKKMENNPKLG